MATLLERLHPTAATRGDWLRNIISLRVSEDLYDDLADDEATRQLLAAVEADRKPPQYGQRPVLARPFEESELTDRVFAAIGYPFAHPNASRFSDGTWGVWYGASTLRTAVYETAYHWHRRFIRAPMDIAMDEPVTVQRRVFRVRCRAALLDLRPILRDHPGLVDPDDWAPGQDFGRRVHRNGYPGLLTRSVRSPAPNARCVAVFRRAVLEDPRDVCFLDYRYEPDDDAIVVERSPGREWFRYAAP